MIFRVGILLLFIIIICPVKVDAQLSKQDVYQLSVLAKERLKEYGKLLRDNAFYHKQGRNSDKIRKESLEKRVLGKEKIFDSKNANVFRECRIKKSGQRLIPYGSKKSVSDWLVLEPPKKIDRAAADIQATKACVISANSKTREFVVSFKSKNEIEPTSCADANGSESRLAIFKYIRDSNDKLKVYIKRISFVEKERPCIDSIPDTPMIEFERPENESVTVNLPNYQLKANVRNANLQAITLIVNKESINRFKLIGNSLTCKIPLKIGKNTVKLIVQNEFKKIEKTVNISRTNSENLITLDANFIYPKVSASFGFSPIPVLFRTGEIPEDYKIQIRKNNSVLPYDLIQENGTEKLFYAEVPIASSAKIKNYKLQITAVPNLGKPFSVKEVNIKFVNPGNNNNQVLSDSIQRLQDSLRYWYTESNRKDILLKDKGKELLELVNKPQGQIDSLNNENQSLYLRIRNLRRDRKKLWALRDTLRKEVRILNERLTKQKKHENERNVYVGLNYSLFNLPSQSSTISPLKQSFQNPTLNRFGLSVYYHVGFFVSNLNFNGNKNPLPVYQYNTSFINSEKEKLIRENTAFKDLTYINTISNLKTFDLGLNLYTPIHPLYLKLGISRVKGETWDIYDGDFPTLQRNQNDLYALDFTEVNSTGVILGLAHVSPYFQVETGFNFLYKDFFLSVGFNYPITGVSLKGFKPRKKEK